MTITCSSCGKTNINPGTTTCPGCGKPLSAATLSGQGSLKLPFSGKPVLQDSHGKWYTLNSNFQAIFIGSHGCGVLLIDPGIPSQAAKLSPSGPGFVLEDLCGSVKLNGYAINSPTPLQPGDRITIGSATLSYQGPGTPAQTPVVPTHALFHNPHTAVLPIQQTLPPLPPGILLKNWGTNPPLVEGRVDSIDGPYRVEKGSLVTKVASSVLLGMISSTLAMVPFWMSREVNLWYLRIEEYSSKKVKSVLMRGEPGSLPQMNDFIAVWGGEKDGNIVMKRGYSYKTDSEIRLKS